jgi:hypothetical protein
MHECKNSGSQVAVASKSLTVMPNIVGPQYDICFCHPSDT